MRDVANKAGVTSGLVHHYFASIDMLVNVVFEEVAEADLASLHEGDLASLHEGLEQVEPEDALRLFIERSVSSSRDATLTIWLSAWLSASRRAGLRNNATRLMDAGANSLAVILERDVRSGVFACDDALTSAQRILTVCDGLLIKRALNFGAVERLGIYDFMRETIESEVGTTLAPKVT